MRSHHQPSEPRAFGAKLKSWMWQLLARLLENSASGDRLRGWICLAVVGIILVAGLLPLRFTAQNNVSWLANTNGLHFPGGEARSPFDPGGVALTPQPLSLSPGATVATGALSIELWLRPAKEPTGARQRVLAVCDASGDELFFIGQWTTQLLGLIRRPGASGKAAFQEIDVPDSLSEGQARFATITSGTNGTAFYLEGALAKQYPNVPLLPATESLFGKRLYLGNSPDGLWPWAGDILGLAVYGRALPASEVLASYEWWASSNRIARPTTPGLMALYNFESRAGSWVPEVASGASNSLFIPDHFAFTKPALEPVDFSMHDRGDLLLNVFGFVPFGFMFALWQWRVRRSSRWNLVVFAVVVGGLLSLGIEWVQVYLPMRDSSLTDLLCNTLGTLLGALIIYWPGIREPRAPKN